MPDKYAKYAVSDKYSKYEASVTGALSKAETIGVEPEIPFMVPSIGPMGLPRVIGVSQGTVRKVLRALPFIGGAAATPLGAIGMGAAGGLGKILENTGLDILGLKPEGGAPRTAVGELKSVGKEVALQAVLGKANELGLAAAKSLYAPFAKKVIPEVAESADIGVRMAPGQQVPSSGVVTGIQEYAETSALGRPAIRKFFEGVNEDAIRASREIASKIGDARTAEEAGILYRQAWKTGLDKFKAGSSQLYSEIDRQAGQIAVPTKSVKLMAGGIEKELGSVLGLLRATDSKIPALLNNIRELPETLSFQEAQAYRSSLLSELRKRSSDFPDRYQLFESRIQSTFNDAMESAARNVDKGGGTEILKQVQEANSMYRRGMDTFNRSFSGTIAKSAKRQPEKVATLIWGKDAITPAREVRNALVGEFGTAEGKATWDILRRRGFENMLETAVRDEATGVSSGVMRSNALVEQWQRIGPEAQKLLAGDALPEVNRLMRVLSAAQPEKVAQLRAAKVGFYERGAAVGGLRTLAAMGSIGAGEASDNRTAGLAGAAIILASPAIAAKLLMSKTGARYLTQGFRVGTNTKAGMRLMTQAFAYAASQPEEK